MIDAIAHGEQVSATPKRPVVVLGAAAVLGIAGLFVATLQSSTASLVMYVLVLLVGTGLIAVYRWLEARRSMLPDHVIRSRWERRAALVPVVVLLLACLANAFVWATEVSKQ